MSNSGLMDILERVWDYAGTAAGGALRGVERSITAMFGSSNARFVRRLQPKVVAIGALEPRYREMSDAELREQTDRFRARLVAGETLDDLLIEAFAVCREAGRRYLNMRHFDVQLVGGMVLHGGAIAEMVTGEGKTLVATLPAYLNALAGKGVHVVTVNDYLARRDMEWMGTLYTRLGLTVGAIQHDMDAAERQQSYGCDITYGTNNEFGFDYLRDNMRPAAYGDDRYPRHMQQCQRRLNFAIVDEVDNILIDEARTPLIISGPAHDDPRKYAEADRIARQLVKGEHFEVNEKDHTATLTDAGVRAAERLAGVESFYTAGNMDWPHLIDNALKAHHLYKLDVNYVVKEGRVVIVDEFTGRLMEGRQWSDGLHQSVEAKEGVKIKEESQTLATITLQNYFKLYHKICGMTGTAMTEATEFWKIYKLDVIAIPTNRGMQRIEHPDVIYCTEEEKFESIADEIERMNKWDTIIGNKGEATLGTVVREEDDRVSFQPKESRQKEDVPRDQISRIERKGRPVLVGTTSIEKSERLARMLERRGIRHEVLNAKQHRREAEIVAQAGRMGAVTIATNMAGRGTDIILGGNPETLAWATLQDKYATRLDVPREEWDALVKEIAEREQMAAQGEQVRQLGGLHVIGTERHEARRIDLQLRGRCGRQGDPGSSRFYLSLRDDLMRIFAGPWVEKILKSLGMTEGEAIESPMVTRRIEAAQKKVEERNFEVRKNLLEYDEVMDEQRKRVYSYRQAILEGINCKDLILQMLDQQVREHLAIYLAKDFGTDSFAVWVGNRLGAQLEPKDFRGMSFREAEQYARDEAQRFSETQILDAIEENLPEEEDPQDWNWQALAKMANSRWGLKLQDRELKKIGRDHVAEALLEKSREAIEAVDLDEGAVFLEEEFGTRSALAWVHHKFGITIDPQEIVGKDAGAIVALVAQHAAVCYDEKESEYPVMAGLYRYSTRGAAGQQRIDRPQLIEWARDRFKVPSDLAELKDQQREQIRDVLLQYSRADQETANQKLTEVKQKVESLFKAAGTAATLAEVSGGNGALESLSAWLKQSLHLEVPAAEIARLDREQLERRIANAIEDQFRPEIRRMERALVLQVVDAAWKDHLLAMDHLRSAVGLVGYAQVDPKVEYKREGMKLFEQMWRSIGQRVTDLVFRMEQLDERFVGSTWVETSATHAEGPTASDIAREQQQAIDASQTDKEKPEPIRHRGQRVGRNDPCPCGSGKKYKNCCMRT